MRLQVRLQAYMLMSRDTHTRGYEQLQEQIFMRILKNKKL
jgi:hypothetical protein